MPRTLNPYGSAHRFAPFLLLLLLCVLAFTATAEERLAAGRVLVAAGTVEAVAADGAVRKLRRRSQLFEGDTVRTGTRGRTQVRFTDGALLSIRPNTLIRVDQYRFANNDTTDVKALTLTSGSFRTVTGRIGRTNRTAYRVSTPLAVIGIRGTDWEALQQPNGPLSLGVNAGGITAQSTTGRSAEIGTGADFNYAQVTADGNLQLLPEPPAVLVEAAAVDSQPAEAESATESDQAAADQPADGESADDGGGESADGETGDLAAGAPPTPPPPSGGGESAGGAGSDGVASVDPGAVPPPTVSINPSEGGAGVPATTDSIDRVLTQAEADAVIAGTQFALVSGMRFSATGNTQSLLALVGADDDDTTPSFNFAFPAALAALTGDRAATLNASNILVQRGDVALTNRVDNVGGITGLTFARYNASTDAPLAVFTDPAVSSRSFGLTSPYVFALFNPASIASLTGRLDYNPANSSIVVSTGTVSTLISNIVMSVNLGTGTIERGVLDIGFGSTADAFVFLADFDGSISNGLLNANVTDIVLQDNGAAQTFAARGSIRGAFTGTGAVTPLVLAFDFADTAGRNQFARGVVQYTGAVAPPPPTFGLTTTEAAQVATGFFFLAVDAGTGANVISGRANDARDSLGSPIFVSSAVPPGTDFLAPSEVGYGVLPATYVARQQGAPTTSFVSSFVAPGQDSLSWGQWLGSATAPITLYDANSGLQRDSLSTTLLWATVQPKARASLVGTALFSSRGGSAFQAILGVGSSGARLPVLTADASLSVDFDTGAVTNGNIFVATDSLGEGEDLGFAARFTGSVVNGAGGAFAELNVLDGAYRGTTPLLAGGQSLQGVFTGSGAQTSLVLGFHMESAPAIGLGDFVSGMLTLNTLTEARVTPAALASLDRIGIAVFNPVDASGNSLGLPSTVGGGILLGRAPAVNAANPSNFFVATRQSGTARAPGPNLDTSSVIVVPGDSTITDVNTAVGTTGAFAVGWGRWQSIDGQPVARNDPSDSAAGVNISSDVLFAAIQPTRVGAVTGTQSYAGVLNGTTNTAELLAFGGALGGTTIPFDRGAMNVSVDFNSGLVNGDLSVGPSLLPIRFAAQFNGRLSNNVADLTLTSLSVDLDGSMVAGDLLNSSAVGVVTGALGDRFLTGFQLVGGGQHVEGLITVGAPK